MTNGEKYKKAFSVLQTSKGSLQEVENMAKLQKRTKMKTAAAVIAGCIILGGTGTAYAANVGGIQRTVQIWLHGVFIHKCRRGCKSELPSAYHAAIPKTGPLASCIAQLTESRKSTESPIVWPFRA